MMTSDKTRCFIACSSLALFFLYVLPALATAQASNDTLFTAPELTASKSRSTSAIVTQPAITSSTTVTSLEEIKAPEIDDAIYSWLKKAFGQYSTPIFFIFLIVALTWSRWDSIVNLAGMIHIVNWLAQPRIPLANGLPFLVLIANFSGEKTRSFQKRFVAEIEKIENVSVTPLRRIIPCGEGNVNSGIDKGRERARRYLKKSGARLVLWGRLVYEGTEKTTVDVHFTTPGLSPRSEYFRYDLSNASIQLPVEFIEHLYDIIHLIVIVEEFNALDIDGQYLVDRLRPLVSKVRQVLSNPSVQNKWAPEARGFAAMICGISLLGIGEQTGDNKTLEEAELYFRRALNDYTRDLFPRHWVANQVNLGNALSRLGERESGTGRLAEAVSAYQDSLSVIVRGREPLLWAAIQNNLGSSLARLAEREGKNRATKILENAIFAFREALKEWTRDSAPLDWAMTQSNVGNALLKISELETGTRAACLEEAVTAYKDSLKERSRDRVPLDWAMSQNNLGTALMSLGGQESGTAKLEDAVAAFDEALKEWDNVRLPNLWATAQYNKGVAIRGIGLRKKDVSYICRALECHLGAHEVNIVIKNQYNMNRTSAEIKEDLQTLQAAFSPHEHQECLENYKDKLRQFGFM
jgi:tetratricopeptide (TPR) repeat protein